MKKILVFILSAMLIMALPVVAYAEEAIVEENVPPVEETVTEGENSAPVEEEQTMTEIIVEYVKEHVEEISVIGTLLATIFYEIRKHGKLNGSIGTLNNNAITIAENSAKAIKDSLKEVEDIAGINKGYKEEFNTFLSEVKKNAEEKQSLEDTLKEVKTFLNTSKLACLEMSNEVAELLVLANIPNSKKEELYDRHKKAVHELEVAEGVIADDGEKA